MARTKKSRKIKINKMGMVIMTSSKIHPEDKIPDFLGDPVAKNPPANAGVGRFYTRQSS